MAVSQESARTSSERVAESAQAKVERANAVLFAELFDAGEFSWAEDGSLTFAEV